MTKLTSKIVTGIAILGLSAPVLAATAPVGAPVPARTTHVKQHRQHGKVAAAEQGAAEKASPKKANVKKSGRKHHGQAGAAGSKSATAPAATPAVPAAPAAK